MLIILEGPDGVGKSTLAQRIATCLAVKFPRDHVQVIHKGAPRLHPLDEYAVPIAEYRPGTHTHLVIDRWHWGEVIYPPLLNRKTKMTPEIFTYVEMLIKMRGGLIINMNEPLNVLQRRFDENGDDVIQREHLPKLIVRYEQVKNSSFNAADGYHDISVDQVIDHARRLEHSTLPFHFQVTPVATTIQPRLVIFGDVRACRGGPACQHRNTQHSTKGPAFMPYAATSGAFLLRALQIKRGLSVALANACDMDSPMSLLNKFTPASKPPYVVALGRNAHVRLERYGIIHATAPHPQFIRRFHSRAVADYGLLIWSLAGSERNELSWKPSSSVRDSSPTLASSATS